VTRPRVLLTGTHNAGCSQRGEGYPRARYGDQYGAFSAGRAASNTSLLAVQEMTGVGIDISGQRSRDPGRFIGEVMDVVVTGCNAAGANRLLFPWAKPTIHASLTDPPAATGAGEERCIAFRPVRDESGARIGGAHGGGNHA